MLRFVKNFFSLVNHILRNIYITFRTNALAKKLLIMLIIKFVLLFIILKAIVYPLYLKPKYENDQKRIETITNRLINN